MKDSKIMRFLFALVLTVNVIAYPIGTAVTSPAKVNKILDIVNFEDAFLNVFKQITIEQISITSGIEKSEVEKQIQGDLISKEQLKKQRYTQVENFFESLDKHEVPTIVFEVENPVSKFTSNLTEKAQSFFDNITNVTFCEDRTEGICKTLGSLLDKLGINQDNESDTSDNTEEQNTSNNMFTMQTSLGINEDNLQSVVNAYKILKYGPQILLIISISFLLIGYIMTFPSTRFARKAFFQCIRTDLFAFAVWGLLPLIVFLTNPVRVDSQLNGVQEGVNQIIGNIFIELAKNAILIPGLFTVATLILMGLIKLYERVQSNDNIQQIQLNKATGVGQTDVVESDEEDDDENEEISNEVGQANRIEKKQE